MMEGIIMGILLEEMLMGMDSMSTLMDLCIKDSLITHFLVVMASLFMLIKD
jgi:hypothetical protein